MMRKGSFLTVSTLAILMVIQSSDLGVLPSEASASSRVEQRQRKTPNPSPTDRGTPITIGTDFSVEITDVKYLSFQVSPLNSELGLHRDDGFHRIKIFWKEFSGCSSHVDDDQVQAKLIFRDGKERVFIGKLNATQDCSGGNCFSTVAVAGFRSDGSPNRFEIQIRDAAEFGRSAGTVITIGRFPPQVTVSQTGNEIDIGPEFLPTPPPSSGSSSASETRPSVQVTSIEYVGLVGNTHRLKILYKVFSMTCFNRRAEFGYSSAFISLFVRDKQTNKSRVIDNSNLRAQLKLFQDCSSTGDCSSIVSVTGKATDAPPAAMRAAVDITFSVNGRGFGEKKGSF